MLNWFGDKMKFRDFISNNMEAVISLWQSRGLITPWNDLQKDFQRKLNVLMKGDAVSFWVAEIVKRIVGSVMGGYADYRGSINYFFVYYSPFSAWGLAVCKYTRLDANRYLEIIKVELLVRCGNQTY